MTRATLKQAATIGVLWTAALAAPVARGAGRLEPEQVDLAAASPEAAALVARADEAGRAGRSREAWELFGRAWNLAPRSPLPPRGICRMALALGIHGPAQRQAAEAACTNALLLGGTAEDMANRVAAHVRGEPPPSMADLVAATLAAEGADRTAPGQPWGALAQVELAVRLNDRALLDAAVDRLRAGGSSLPQVRAAIDRAAPHVGRAVWVTLALLLLVSLTVADALAGRRRLGHAVLAAGFVLLVGGRGVAAPIDDAHPERSVPTPAQQLADPLAFGDLITELGARAQAATARHDDAAAARYDRALALAVPDRAYGYARLCDVLERAGDREGALGACRTALTKAGTTAADYGHLVRLLLSKPGPLAPAERLQVQAALAALQREPLADLYTARVACNVAAHEHDVAALEACTGKLSTAAPNDPSTLAFAWALAIERHDRDAIGAISRRAIDAGLDPARVAQLQRASIGPRARRWATALRWGVEGALVFGLLLGTGWLVGRRWGRLAALRERES